VVAEHHLCDAGINEPANDIDDTNTVWAAIDQISDEYERSFDRARRDIDAEPLQQREQRIQLAVHVTDDIEGAIGQALEYLWHRPSAFGSATE
jgi:hypothetical protein